DLSERPRPTRGRALIRTLRLFNGAGQPASRIACGDALTVEFELELDRPLGEPQLGVGFDNHWGQRICTVTTFLSPSELPPLAGICRVRCRIPEVPLVPGQYTLTLHAGSNQEPLQDHLENAVAPEVL